MSLDIKISVLVSVGIHTKSQRHGRADRDAKALEMCLSLVESEEHAFSKDNIELVHAGEKNESVLRSYLGMGMPNITLLKSAPSANIVPGLADYLRQSKSSLVLAGTRAETGEGSGACPVFIAQQLGWAMLSGVVEIVSLSHQRIEVLQALPRGQRRKVSCALPCVLTVDSAAPQARQSAYGASIRGAINTIEAKESESQADDAWVTEPAQKKPKRLKVVKAKTAADRFKAATAKAQSSGGKVLQSESVEEKAQAIFDALTSEKILKL